MLPARLRQPLREHLARVKRQYDEDLARGAGSVWLPDALWPKYPRAPWEWAWQWLFPDNNCRGETEAVSVIVVSRMASTIRDKGFLDQDGHHAFVKARTGREEPVRSCEAS